MAYYRSTLILITLIHALHFIHLIESNEELKCSTQSSILMNIKGGAMLNSRLLIILNDWSVYELNRTALNVHTHHLKITGNPIPFVKKWPEVMKWIHDMNLDLNNVARFVVNLANSIPLMWLLLSKSKGLVFNLDNETYHYKADCKMMPKDTLISDDSNKDHIYIFKGCDQLGIVESLSMNLFTQSIFGICIDLNGRLSKVNDDCRQWVNWPVIYGFAASQNLYLFTNNSIVYIVPTKIFDKAVNVIKRTFREFFQCSDDNQSTTSSNGISGSNNDQWTVTIPNGKSSDSIDDKLYKLLISIIVILVLIIILISLFLIYGTIPLVTYTDNINTKCGEQNESNWLGANKYRCCNRPIPLMMPGMGTTNGAGGGGGGTSNVSANTTTITKQNGTVITLIVPVRSQSNSCSAKGDLNQKTAIMTKTMLTKPVNRRQSTKRNSKRNPKRSDRNQSSATYR
ncbi:hypothetical protein BLOT_011378 [Blomia tropicalis]|nr:hypothetical protein BLOT_011378 [Blomia tropicalis]